MNDIYDELYSAAIAIHQLLVKDCDPTLPRPDVYTDASWFLTPGEGLTLGHPHRDVIFFQASEFVDDGVDVCVGTRYFDTSGGSHFVVETLDIPEFRDLMPTRLHPCDVYIYPDATEQQRRGRRAVALFNTPLIDLDPAQRVILAADLNITITELNRGYVDLTPHRSLAEAAFPTEVSTSVEFAVVPPPQTIASTASADVGVER